MLNISEIHGHMCVKSLIFPEKLELTSPKLTDLDIWHNQIMTVILL